MGKMMSMNKGPLYSFLIYPAAILLFISGCATDPAKAAVETGENKAIALQQSNVTSPSQQKVDSVSVMPVAATTALKTKTADEAQTQQVQDAAASEPRIFFESGKSKFNEVLGIDFSMADNGKSRLIVTTEKKTTYDLLRKDEKTLVLKIHDSTIASPLLMRQIDTTQFQSALEGIKQVYSSKNHEVELIISLRELVTFNVKPTDTGISIDFGQTSVKVADNKIVPLNLAETETKQLSSKTQAAGAAKSDSSATDKNADKYKGQQKMYLDFVGADVTDILKLVNEVSDKNIIWDPAIKGRTVSMVLKNVPWEEVLNLILDNNDLGREDRGENIIWVASKEKILAYQTKKKAEAQAIKDAEALELEKQKQLEKAAKEDETLVTEYLPVDFAKADEIKKHVTVSKRGAMSVDTRTNTIIITDVAESLETAKKTIKQFDTPVKQIMIEARIVNASDSFKRDLGVNWNSTTSAWTNSAGELSSDTTSQNALEFGTAGETGFGGNFSTNSPDGWSSNLGLSFATLTSDGTSALTLDASLALAESNGTAKTLSAPKVIAQEGSSAKISSGEIIKIAATENVKSEEWPAELSLEVTPTSVSYNNYVTLTVSVSDDQRVSDTLKTTKTINTTCMVYSGDTIVIGGIIKETEGEDENGVPVLKDIPGLGWLFKAKTKSTSKSELLIFITPTVMPSPVK